MIQCRWNWVLLVAIEIYSENSLQSYSSIMSNVVAQKFSSVEADAHHGSEEQEICVCKHGAILNSYMCKSYLCIFVHGLRGIFERHASGRCDCDRLD